MLLQPLKKGQGTAWLEGPGLIPGCGNNILQATRCGLKKESPHLCHVWHHLPELTPAVALQPHHAHTPFSAKSKKGPLPPVTSVPSVISPTCQALNYYLQMDVDMNDCQNLC